MIDLTPEDVAEFQALFLEETGKRITEDQAREYATNLIDLVAFVLRDDLSPRR